MKMDRKDREFLRSLNIDPESTLLEDMQDIITAPCQYLPHTIIITQEAARLVIKEYGKLTIETYWAYRAKFG